MNECYIANDRDKPRYKRTVKMRVKNRETACLSLGDGNAIDPGTHDVTVYVDRAERIKALVETDQEAIKAAKRSFENKVAAKAKEAVGFTGTDFDFVKAVKDGDQQEYNEAWKAEMARTPHSIQGCFRELVGRDMLPLDSADIVDGSEEVEPQIKAEVEKAALFQRAAAQYQGQPESAMSVAAVLATPQGQQAIADAVKAHLESLRNKKQ